MTTTITTLASPMQKTRRASMLALALSLSAGTVAGMFGIAAFTAGPAQAQSAGNGGGGASTGGGGAGANPMAVGAAEPNAVAERQRPARTSCEGSAGQVTTTKCRFVLRSTPRG